MRHYDRISLGILAGGRASRLEGVDKAFARYENQYLSQRILNLLDVGFRETFISARGADERFAAMNLQAVFDTRSSFSGPLAGIEALLNATNSEYLLTIPVDIKFLPMDLIADWLDNPQSPGHVLHDMNGLQPLLALWHVRGARIAVKQALDMQEKAVHSVVSRLNFKVITRTDVDIGNLNTPRDFETP